MANTTSEKSGRLRKPKKIESCQDCKWFNHKWDTYGECKGFPPRVSIHKTEPCNWAVAHVEDSPCFRAEKK